MALLYLVTEGRTDSTFFEQCAIRLSGQSFSWSDSLQPRKNSGSAALIKLLKDKLLQIKASAGGDEVVCCIAALDNDRSPHPENEKTLDRTRLIGGESECASRLEWMNLVVESVLGSDRSAWPLQFAAAVPVEMLESWSTKALNEDKPSQGLPHFSVKDSPSAEHYYHGSPPLQWKDLERLAREKLGLPSDVDFYSYVVQVIAQDPDALASRSLSFLLFWEQLKAWSPSPPTPPSPP